MLESAHVLIVDDDPRMVSMLERWLVGAGYSVTGVTTTQAALSALGSNVPDWVITDLMMPMGDGMDILAQTLSRQPRTKVIIMTAFGSEATRQRAMAHGAYAFLSKPFSRQSLLSVLDRDPSALAAP